MADKKDILTIDLGDGVEISELELKETWAKVSGIAYQIFNCDDDDALSDEDFELYAMIYQELGNLWVGLWPEIWPDEWLEKHKVKIQMLTKLYCAVVRKFNAISPKQEVRLIDTDRMVNLYNRMQALSPYAQRTLWSIGAENLGLSYTEFIEMSEEQIVELINQINQERTLAAQANAKLLKLGLPQ